MDFRVDISKSANSDIENALAWVYSRSEKLGERWVVAFESALESLERMPNHAR